MNQTIIDIAVLNLFFNNYSQDQLKELLQNRTGAASRFTHFWNSKRFEYKTACTGEQLWKGFVSYLEPERSS